MTFKITVVLRMGGRIDAEHVSELRACLLRYGPNVVLDLDEVQLVDVAVVRFLARCEAAGMELRNCSRYIRNGWIGSDRDSVNQLQEES